MSEILPKSRFFRAVPLLLTALVCALVALSLLQGGRWFLSTCFVILAMALFLMGVSAIAPRVLEPFKQELWRTIEFFRVTRRGGLFVLLVVLIAFSTLNSGNNLLILVVSCMLAALLVSGSFSNVNLYALAVRLSLPEAIYAGQRVVLHLTLENLKQYIPSFALLLRTARKGKSEEGGTDFFDHEQGFPYVGARGSHTSRLECTFDRRGVYPVSGFEVRTRFPFGLFMRGRRVDAEGRITVFPSIVPVRKLLVSYPVLQGGESRNEKGRGSGLYNIRDYQLGDDVRFVHWKSTGKLSRLMLKEFVQEEDDFLQLVFSTYCPSRDPRAIERFEAIVSYVASLAKHYREANRIVDFYSGEFTIRLDGEKQNFDALMEYLAWVQVSDRRLIEPWRVKMTAVLFAVDPADDLPGIPRIEVQEP